MLQAVDNKLTDPLYIGLKVISPVVKWALFCTIGLALNNIASCGLTEENVLKDIDRQH